jgi:hypothetical protein
MAMRAESLRAAGGLQPLRDQLLMDSVLARRVVAAGGRVRLHAFAAPVEKRHARWNEWWSQVMRWQTSMWHALPRLQYSAFLWLRCGGIAASALVFLAPPASRSLAWAALACYALAHRIGPLNALHTTPSPRHCGFSPRSVCQRACSVAAMRDT